MTMTMTMTMTMMMMLVTMSVVSMVPLVAGYAYGIRPAAKPQGIGAPYDLVMYQKATDANNGIDDEKLEAPPLGFCSGIFANIQQQVYTQAANNRYASAAVRCYGYNNGIACMVDDESWVRAKSVAKDYCLNTINGEWKDELLSPSSLSSSSSQDATSSSSNPQQTSSQAADLDWAQVPVLAPPPSQSAVAKQRYLSYPSAGSC